jgi:iron uptake system EfeUOB component EfeO/EfeM
MHELKPMLNHNLKPLQKNLKNAFKNWKQIMKKTKNKEGMSWSPAWKP